MKTLEEVKVGNVYFYNNRPVKVLGIELNGSIRVSGDFKLMSEASGEYWCTHCMVGGSDYKGACVRDEYQEVIDDVLENIGGTEVFWVHSYEYLKKEPFEWKENKELLKTIAENKKLNEKLKNGNDELVEYGQKLSNELSEKQRDLGTYATEIVNLKHEIKNIQNDLFFYQHKKDILETPGFYSDDVVKETINRKPILPLALELMKQGNDSMNGEWCEDFEMTIYDVRYFFKKIKGETKKDFDHKRKQKWEYYNLMLQNTKTEEITGSGYILQVYTETSNDGNYSKTETEWK